MFQGGRVCLDSRTLRTARRPTHVAQKIRQRECSRSWQACFRAAVRCSRTTPASCVAALADVRRSCTPRGRLSRFRAQLASMASRFQPCSFSKVEAMLQKPWPPSPSWNNQVRDAALTVFLARSDDTPLMREQIFEFTRSVTRALARSNRLARYGTMRCSRIFMQLCRSPPLRLLGIKLGPLFRPCAARPAALNTIGPQA